MIEQSQKLFLQHISVFNPFIHLFLSTGHERLIKFNDPRSQSGENNAEQQFLVPFGFHGHLSYRILAVSHQNPHCFVAMM